MNKNIIISILILGTWSEIEGSNFGSITSRVINGRAAGPCEFPYQIRLSHPPFLCGGSLITVNGKHLILTAAHCVSSDMNPENYEVVAGNILKNRQQSTEQRRQVTKIVIHKDYNRETRLNDIALLSIQKPFQINRYVSPISLPKHGQKTGTTGVVSGWGIVDELGPTSNVLLAATITMWPDSYCSSLYPGFYNPSVMICAGAVRGACKGDSGGPLVDKQKNQLAGIVSFGEGTFSQTYGELSSLLPAIPKISRIANGQSAKNGEIPYQVGLYLNGNLICGGSFIVVKGKHLVITAAHCVELDWNADHYIVVAGEVKKNSFTSPAQVRTVTQILAHEEYEGITLLSDIAILEIGSPFEINRFVSPIRLPRRKERIGSVGVVSGWGDSGGPLKNYKKGFLAGIVSFGRYSCDRPGSNGVFTRITAYLKWIEDTAANIGTN
ncbi:Trypsin-1 [Orchesella cincta]|uniref:Trypsin-1 n=1 Tax=Orchesella cincta TaxID=48709 RepID=A0A1D2N2Z6_ORCCI|nr:Trypsin-1 [Orchesella cincta]